MKQVEKKHYSINYESKRRFASYWHQIDETLKLQPESVLEIGKGSGFFSSFMRNKGINIRTLDIAADLKPDIVASLLSIPLDGKSVDLIVCCQVLEHLPFDKFSEALHELKRVAKKNVIVSLPQKDPGWYYAIHLPYFGRKDFLLDFSLPLKNSHVFDGEHYWEIGKKGYPVSKITREIENNNFKILKTYRVKENSYHRFYVLEVDS